MSAAKEHYDRQLAAIYSWMSGSAEVAIDRNRQLFYKLGIDEISRGLVLDLGAGSGFQSIPLAELGFSVVAIDFCDALLSELRDRSPDLPIQTVHDDLLNFANYIQEPAQLIICMGDTITHLESLAAIESLLANIESALTINGTLILSFRDYVTVELTGTQRFIPVRSDESTILTCFLEYQEKIVQVYDLLYQKQGNEWLLNTSCYPKLRLDKNWVDDRLTNLGLQVIKNEMMNGMVYIVAKKNENLSLFMRSNR